MFDFQEELRKLPDQPGVYIMHDKTDAIIYIGKAVSLRKRVRQYFQPSHDEGIKKKQMVEHIARFEYIITDSELEALVLECNLIKEHTPKYNTMLRDDKTYPYIRVTVQEDFPRVLFSRQVKKDKSRYFGPYTSAGAVKDTIELINKLYKLRTCSRKLPRDIGLDRACLNYHIHQCGAPCQGYVDKETYGKQVSKALEFLNGNYAPVLCELKEKSRLNKCDCENINGNKLDKNLMEKISELIAPNSKICEELKKISFAENIENDELVALKEAYNKNQKSLENLIKKIQYVDIELIDDINKEVKLIKQKNLKIKEKIDTITNNVSNTEGVTFSEKEIAKIVMEIIENHFKKFEELDILEQRNLLKLLINKATGSGNDVEIDLLNTDNTSFLRTSMLPTSEHRK